MKKNVSKRSYIIRKQHITPPPSQIPIPRVLGVNSKSPSLKSTKKKKKNVSIRSYTIRKQHTTPPPSQIPIQESWTPISSLQVRNLQKKRKRMLVYVLI